MSVHGCGNEECAGNLFDKSFEDLHPLAKVQRKGLESALRRTYTLVWAGPEEVWSPTPR